MTCGPRARTMAAWAVPTCPTTFALSPARGSPERTDARLFNGSGQLAVFLLPRRSLVSLFLSGGVGVISRGGVAFTGSAETTNVSRVFGAGAMLLRKIT